ncbi:DNA-binding transcriptional LysR family regulator [Tamaricihabitans halophyticus]|uniref:DNA-binding transcriptional LysR family regulator n=1 Tax=Tamaricihabitans halophyticus TaxID=1262583 RepID=A0A4V2SS11_9PSEU|nr:LysR family transcriptional regulator [Tamaricihabitans halophyticus]TCP45086.1 DNA-binding transcriptional LysR family regulator [Tamaricihabitans halophyticus]
MTLKQLRAFLEAVRTGSFTAAATRMGITQASVSELIRKLEDEHGTPVFSRGSRRLVLTAAGSALLPFAERAVAAADGAHQALRSVRSLRGGVATFGLLRNAAYYLLSDLAEHFHDSYPEVRIRLIGLNSVEVAAEVAAGTVEAGLVVLPIDDAGLRVTPLLRDEVCYASTVPERVAEPVTIAGLANSRLILYDAHYGWTDPTRRQLAERAQLAGVKLEPWIEVEHVESALSLVDRGIGDTIVSHAVAQSGSCPPSVRTVPFAEPLYDTIALVQRESEVLSPASRELSRLAQRMLLARSST